MNKGIMYEPARFGRQITPREVCAMRMRACTGNSFRKGLLKPLCGGLAALALFFCSSVIVDADDSLSCYKGAKDNGIYIGDISGANFQNAAAECNSNFSDCNGECYGCYLDEDSSTILCVDSQGKKFTR
jgi:hypothetical protein